MDSGVHIGLAAWLHHRCDGEGFAAWPGAPVALRLARLEGAENSEDMARVAEFSRMVNFVACRGAPARPFDSAAPLWEVHSDLLGAMEFAERAWTEAENAAFTAARAMLYGPDGMTPLYRLYQEFRTAYQDLLTAASGADVLREAMIAWEIEGGKSVIEAAMATIERLMTRSTLSRAQAERDALLFLPVDPAGAGYAMTGFAPISALDDSGWISASVELNDIDGAVSRAQQRETAGWRNWRQGKTGKLCFRYAILLIDRDWFTPQLYRAEDWNLPGQRLVSDGGTEGALPAYPARLYAVRDVTLKPDPPKPSKPQRPSVGMVSRPPVATLRPLQARPSVATLASRPRPVLGTARAKGLSATTLAKPLSAAPVITASALRPSLSATALSRPTVAGGLTLSAKPVARLKPGTIEQIGNLTVQRRLAAARQIVARVSVAGSPPPDPTLWAVGFGCESLPEAPNPHPGYGWN
ncbi:hypothetical protein [Aliiruegeria sabulilitoris]|uniref:hypothetical protein n=1 Tax=Aliiruegeria sabulilitoris TaxID=1510458 RepID=UPI00082F448E|nr:hypothetical protein [Aliiruegeria sabulilitoris]NDR56195.1 hypothetical protein [Pseudoruegeria sp. M32A2M]